MSEFDSSVRDCHNIKYGSATVYRVNQINLVTIKRRPSNTTIVTKKPEVAFTRIRVHTQCAVCFGNFLLTLPINCVYVHSYAL